MNIYQRSTVREATAQLFNRRRTSERVAYRSLLNFLLLFLSREKVYKQYDLLNK